MKPKIGDVYLTTDDCWYLDRNNGAIVKTKWLDFINNDIAVITDKHPIRTDFYKFIFDGVEKPVWYHIKCMQRLCSKNSPLLKLLDLI